VASCVGAAAFFALEAVTREAGAASELAATEADQGTTMLIGASYGLAAVLSPVLRRLPAGRLPPVSGPAGTGAMAAGLALRAWSMRTLGSRYSRTLRTTSDQAVAGTGPYRLIRHPGYLGSIMVWTGFAVASGSAPAALAVLALMSAAYRRRMAAEEEMLAKELGAAYTDYSQRTKRLIPFLW
jgi:protein-S-isoprenylcysteine O-methyltransferase Ste14